MRTLRLLAIALAVVGASSVASAQWFMDDFESYTPGVQMHGQGGWKGWDGSEGASAPASDVVAFSGTTSVLIQGGSDFVHQFDITGGKWVFSIMQYIPSGGSGVSDFILLNTYTEGGDPKDWSITTGYDLATGEITPHGAAVTNASVLFDQWVELKWVIDLNLNTVEEYYDGILIESTEWDDDTNGTLQCVDLWGNNAGAVYYDDLLIVSYFEYMASATAPNPAAQAIDVPRDVVLSWTAGAVAATHDVYFGTAYDVVSTADRANPMGVLASRDQAGTTFDPDGLLDLSTTYYWRVDEVNAAPDNTIFKGEVLSFTAESYVYPVQNIVVTSNTTPEEGANPANTVDGSGLNENGEHSVAANDMWLAAPGTDPAYIQFEFDRVYKLDEMRVWNYNGEFEMVLAFGTKDVTVEYSTDGIDWMVLGDVTLAQGTAEADYTANTTVDFAGVGAKFVKLTINSGYGMFGKYGLSEVRFLQIPAHARQPQPADGADDVSVATTLDWYAGREAVSHEVSLGTDPDALALVGTVDITSFAPEALDLETTYYWQVNEVNEADAITTWAGDLWSFTTESYRVVDDFESYTDDIEAGQTIFDTWNDGYEVPANGALVGNAEAPFAETVIVAGGTQAMILSYDNSGTSYSEAEANTADLPVGSDWTKGSPETLVLWVHGDPGNAAGDQLYVKINGTQVAYPSDLSVPIWKQWKVDLAGLNVSNVSTLTIGVDGNGAGVLYVDDIALYRQAPVVAEPGPEGDPSLVAHWKLDETEGMIAADSSGYANDGTLIGMDGTEWTTGTLGGALEFNGAVGKPQYVDFGNDVSLQLAGSVTISAWVKMAPNNAGAYMGVGGKLKTAPYKGFSLVRHSSNVFRLWVDNGAGEIAGSDASSDTPYTDTEWHHLIGVVNDGTSSLYVDGVKQAKEGAVSLNDSGQFAHIGRQYSGLDDRYWKGLIDDFRIYYRALSAQEISEL